MSHDDRTLTVAGEITEVVVHRFVPRTAEGNRLDDLGPEAAKAVSPAAGDGVALTGRRKPTASEVPAKDRDGRHHEHHVARDGGIRKARAGDPARDKWLPDSPAAA